ncbi:MAG TPA: efflux RND transporter periplasmic adaptor subunit [Candidatus Eisenbacteria bacterium]|nr:efflux RND transporter periplasmic adaptor subunit [Candidatus Eisenbacteria bacterium]
MNLEFVRSARGRSTLFAAALVLFVSLAAITGCAKEAPPPPPPPEVTVAEVVQKDVPIYIELVGSTLGSEDVEIRARVEGYLTSVNFTEGSFVRKGQTLYKIDPQPFEAALSQAQANLSTARTRLDKTNNDVARYKPLAAEKAVSQQELDNALSAQEAARFQVTAYDALVEKAKLDMAYTTINSPVDGLIGTTQKKVGSLVGRGENTLLNTISQINPILFRCAIAEAEYLRLARAGADKDKSLEKKFGVELILADGTTFNHKGRLDAIERAVDASTGTLTGQFSFPNPERILRPGQYGKARFVTDVKEGALLVPQLAVQEIQGLYSVMVVKPDATVEQRMVKAGERVGNVWIIDSGLKPGEKVIVEGIQKVKPGVQVSAKVEKVKEIASPAESAPASVSGPKEVKGK